MKKTYSQNDVLRMIRDKMSTEGWSQSEAAQFFGISASFLSDILKGYRAPGGSVIRKLGLKKKVLYCS